MKGIVRRLGCGLVFGLVLTIAVGILATRIPGEAVEKAGHTARDISLCVGGVLIGGTAAMAIVGGMLLAKLQWGVEQGPSKAPIQVVLHGPQNPGQAGGQPALPPPGGWRPERQWNVVGQPEEVTDAKQVGPGQWG